MKRFTVLFLCLALAAGSVQARSVARLTSLEGDVLDSLTREPIPFAPVELSLNGITTRRLQADSNGHYAFPALAAAKYMVQIGKPGYADKTQQITLKAGEANKLDFLLAHRAAVNVAPAYAEQKNTAAPGTLKGSLYDKASGEAIPFAIVYLTDESGKPTPYVVQADIDGFFSLPKIPAGNYTVNVKNIGYKLFQLRCHIDRDKILQQNIYLEADDITIGEVEITSHDRRSIKTKDSSNVVDVEEDFIALPNKESTPKHSRHKKHEEE